MRGVTRILVVVDTRKQQQTALQRAIQIAHSTGASLHLLAPNPNASADSLKQLESLTEQAQQKGISCTCEEHWRKNITDTIIHIRQMERSQLVIKDYQEEEGLHNPFATPNNWSLLRQSRVPVLLVRTSDSWDKGTFLAAVNADPDFTNHQQLNTAILDNARTLTQLFDAELHLTSAHPTTMLALQDKGDGLTDKDRYQRVCDHYGHDFGIAKEHVHVEPGPAETLVPNLSSQLQTKLLVMGTMSRTGLKAMTLGNTAEQIIRHIHCDLLVVQPKHHMMPLEQELED